ncbi:hypothetical protein POM88_006644 [Heracleum sosnowskyi]|uniref:UDP-glycosyltransferase n=1 Tax=Heracleum sosnowskyi TaxID=360622 RepID=A0AAD8N5Q8_9APIA|nr:hypothetical protein POM88_006644 [Heracleum sosnowskyi]
METQGKQIRKRLVLVPFPFQGHMTPMFQLGTALQQKGLSVTIAHTRYNAPHPSHYPQFDFQFMSDKLTSDDSPKSLGVFDFIKKININCESEMQEFLVHKIDQKQESYGQVVGIIYDTLMYCAEAVANNLKIPSMVIRTSFATYVLATLAMPRLHAQGYLPLQDSMLEEPVAELYPLRFRDLPFTGGTIEESLVLYAITCLELESTLDRKHIESVIRRIFGEKEGDEMRRRATEIKEKIESCMSAGGSSSVSLDNLVEFFL